MDADDAGVERPSKRSKVDVACDTCRQRKTRCDGKRPVCSNCEVGFRACSYRTSGDGHDTNMNRLSEVEARLRALETMNSHPRADGVMNGNAATGALNEIQCVPQLHTAAGHKILHCWPRLRVKYSHPSIEPLRYLQESDAQDTSLMQTPQAPIGGITFWELSSLLESLQNIRGQLPIALAHLLRSTEVFSGSDLLYKYSPPSEDPIAFDSLSIPCLLVCVVILVFDTSHDEARRPALPSSEDLFKLALRNSWQAYAETPTRQIPALLLVAYIHVYVFSRPFHAIGILRHVSSMFHLPYISKDDHQMREWVHLHFLLESDLLTELDGSATTPNKLLAKDLFDYPDNIFNDGQVEPYSETSSPVSDSNGLFAYHIRLRLIQNNILVQLYTTSKAYCHPLEIGETVSRVSRDLEEWYRSLPLAVQFSRSSMGHIDTRVQNWWRLLELSQRYFWCQFLLNRPVFYFILHEDMEQSASPPEVMAAYQGIQPWMKDACYMSVKSAVMILTSRTLRQTCNNWCDNQLLLAAHLMTLQAQLKSETSGLGREFGDIDSLLDRAEAALASSPIEALVDSWTLEILRNVRQEVQHSLQSQTSPL